MDVRSWNSRVGGGKDKDRGLPARFKGEVSLPRKIGKACSVRCHGCQDPKTGDEERGKGLGDVVSFSPLGGEKEEGGVKISLLTLHLCNDPFREKGRGEDKSHSGCC